jgi:hypothetical protein
MSYPSSSDVSAGQPTQAAHYNNLRKDALYLGNEIADSKNIGQFFDKFADAIQLEYLATNRVRVPYNLYKPAMIMIGGCMLIQTANVDLAAGSFAGGAATYYIHAVRTTGSTTFTLSVNTSPVETTTSRVIGTVYWDASSLYYLTPLFPRYSGLPAADYDSGWFAVTYNTSYSKNHNLGTTPRMVMVYHNDSATGANDNVPVTHTWDGVSLYRHIWSASNVAINIITANSSTNGTCYSNRRISGGGYYRIYAWV